jgi:eukaryotic-like serine/threonine-protein kinase
MEDPERACPKCGTSYPSEVLFCPKDGSPLASPGKTELDLDPYQGLSVSGQFRIEQLIGIGAMGRVYRAHQRGIERQVAIKILHRDLMRNPTVSSRFHREAKVASRLSHPNVVQVLMVGELEHLSTDVGGEAYLVMEYLDGISLRSALAAAGGAMALPRAMHVILQVCDAVGEAHAQGIVHRDLKPENVMLVRRGDDNDFAKVLDFGVARVEWADTTTATQAGVIFGTARYISPEGARGEGVASPSDVYSIATMLFHCLAGKTPFDGDSPVAILLKHTTADPPDVRSIARASYVPEPLARLIARNLAKDPADRCPNARELGRALLDAARDSGLRPAELVVRSTLLGESPSASSLESLQRTRTLDLTPELAERMASTPGAGQTRLLDTGSEATKGTKIAADASGRVEPTMADEPWDGVNRSSVASTSGPPPASRAGAPPSTAAPDGERSVRFSDADWEPRSDGTASGPTRIGLILAFFAIGAVVALLVALRLGAFDTRERALGRYLERARAALELEAWDSPPRDNVRELTDIALRRWPGEPRILEIRQTAADRLLRHAAAARRDKPDEATHFARLAAEFDPDSARRALGGMQTPPAAKPAEGPLPVESAMHPGASGSRTPSGKAPGTPPKVSSPQPSASRPAPTSESPPAGAPTTGAGRWL